ncbi:hypothetical protein NCCP2716_23620 [Sporosarcina sp. NCCP-2716]|uniref:hypothetical protein n=1 Tax=Sporosarcina sp. NCCP-2716 TaxID=2943679 RepID=UPI002040826D|nr:hypothetical protein [Sporosarcina sp. NCCP-2716]GKV69864.1 hypothetical protein NCCP2716_23620 [Sporosarcina sp. NCCP-2716]
MKKSGMLKRIGSTLRFLSEVKNLKYYWSQVIIVIIPIILVIFPNLPSVIKKSWVSVSIFIIAMGITVIFSLKIPENYSKKEKIISDYENEIAGLRSFLESTPERVIKSIFNYLGFGYGERITVYRYESAYFVPVGRYSKNLEFKKLGRDRYDYTEGFIGLAWQQGEIVVENLPDPEKQAKGYIREVNTQCKIEEETLSSMSMKSRSYYCINLDDNHEPIAVIVFESMKHVLPKNIDEIKKLMESSIGKLIVDVINMNIPPGKEGE